MLTEPWTVEGLEAEIRSRGGAVTLVGSVSAETLAATLGVSLRTVERWRASGVGPPNYTHNGLPNGRRYYRLSDLAAHLNAGLAA